jgi:hypothetical protein
LTVAFRNLPTFAQQVLPMSMFQSRCTAASIAQHSKV